MRDWLLARRNKILLNPLFHKWVFRLPLLRSIGRRRSQELFDICAGFVYAQVLAACVRLELFEKLRGGAQSQAALAEACGVPVANIERLLRAAASLRLVQRFSDGRYGLGELGAASIATPGVREMVLHHSALYADLRDPVALLRGEVGDKALADYWPYAEDVAQAGIGAGQVAAYSDLMAASLPNLADAVLDAYAFDRHVRLLDVGGGSGGFLRAVGQRHPSLELMLFDLPAVGEHAGSMESVDSLDRRISFTGGNFKVDPLPRGADIVSLVRILLDHDEATCMALLRSIAASLVPGGRILIAEPMSCAAQGERVPDAYFGFYLLAMGGGRARQPIEILNMLRCAGFENPRLVRTNNPVLTQVIVADCPKLNVKFN